MAPNYFQEGRSFLEISYFFQKGPSLPKNHCLKNVLQNGIKCSKIVNIKCKDKFLDNYKILSIVKKEET